MSLLALLPSFLDPETLVATFGLIGLLVIVFAESGLLVGFFLPGDSLLFTAGLLSVSGVFPMPLWLLLVLVPIAAIAGDQVGYLFGRRVGPHLYQREKSRLFRQEHVHKAQAFFDKHGSKTIVLARFVPIVRTFAPVLAGVGGMHYATFVRFNVLGGILWGTGVTALGGALGQVAFVRENVEIMLLAIVGISVLPIAFEVLRSRRRAEALPPRAT